MALSGLSMQICLIDSDGTVLYVNPAWQQFALDNGGDPAKAGVGSNYLSILGYVLGDEQDDARRFAQQLSAVLRGEAEQCSMEYPCLCRTELRWYRASVVRVPGFEPACAVISHQAVTEQRMAQARYRETQRLGTLSALAAGMAHDFNNVLGVILGNVSLALGDLEQDHPARPSAVRIEQAVMRARALVRRMLALGRGEVQAPSAQALKPLVQEALTMLHLSMPDGVELRADLSDEPLWVFIDSTDLQQALMNLVHNAWQALKGRAGGWVSISLHRDGLGHARLCVQDNGCGMSEPVQARIFEPYFTTRSADEGTGLGLAQVKAAAERFGAHIRLDSDLGQGSQFALRLPLCPPGQWPAADGVSGPAEPAEWAKPTPVDPLPFAAAQPATGARVMLVDDDEVVGLTFGFFLERAGHEVMVVSSAEHALQQLSQASSPAVNLLITDQTMPGMSGLQLCRRVRQMHAGLPVVLMSGSITAALAAEVTALGRSRVVPKEDAAQRLLEAVDGLLASV